VGEHGEPSQGKQVQKNSIDRIDKGRKQHQDRDGYEEEQQVVEGKRDKVAAAVEEETRLD
jgi:hypothetical protein